MDIYDKIAHKICSLEGDKYMHLLLSQIGLILLFKVVSLLGASMINALLIGLVVVLGIGIIKEFIDMFRHHAKFDFGDFSFDVAGCIIGTTIILVL